MTFSSLLSFVPDAATLAAYSLACFVLFVTPGPDMSLYLARTLQGGRQAGIASMAGALTGCCLHTMAAALGLSALIAASATWFGALKIVGAIYLAFLAYQSIRHGSALTLAEGETRDVPFWRSYAMGLAVNLTNPKVVLFFITFLPQFVDARDAHASGKLMFLGLYFVAFSIPLAVAQILVAERLISSLRANPKIMRAVDYLFGGVFGFFAAKILTTQTR